MANFDIIETAGKAYVEAWSERKYLLRLCMIPILTQVIFFGISNMLGYQDNIIRHTLVILPAYFMLGWLIAHVARFVFFKERWPVELSGDTERDVAYLTARGRAIFSAIILFTLIQMGLNLLLLPNTYSEKMVEEMPRGGEITTMALLVSVVISMVMIWGFKFIFLHIPLAVDLTLRQYLEKFKGITPSLYLLFASLICFIFPQICGHMILLLTFPVFEGSLGAFILYRLVVDAFARTIGIVLVTMCISMILKHIFTAPPPQET